MNSKGIMIENSTARRSSSLMAVADEYNMDKAKALMQKKTAVFFTTFHHGHINPLLALARVYIASNYDVHFFTSPERQSAVEESGSTFHVDNEEYQGDVARAAIDEVRQMGYEPTQELLNKNFIQQILPATKAYLEDGTLVKRVANLSPNVIVADVSCYWGVLVSQFLRVPLITSCSCAVMESSEGFIHLRDVDFLQAVCRWLKTTYGIDHDPKDSYMNTSDYTISWSIQEMSDVHPMNIHFFGSAIAEEYKLMLANEEEKDRTSDDSLMNQLDQVPSSKKLVYLSMGTVVGKCKFIDGPQMLHHLYESVFEAVRDMDDVTMIISTGYVRNLKMIPDNVPSNVIIRESVNQKLLLSKVKVFITHGGNNSVNESLLAGCPMIILPFFGDQHQNAAKIESYQLGSAIASPFAPHPTESLGHITPRVFADTLDQVLRQMDTSASQEFQKKIMVQNEWFREESIHSMEDFMMEYFEKDIQRRISELRRSFHEAATTLRHQQSIADQYLILS